MPWPSRLKFSEKISASTSALSHSENDTSGPWNRGRIAHFPLSRTQLAIHQISREPSSWKMIDFLILLALTSLALCKDLFCWHKQIYVNEPWQKNMQLKSMKMKEASDLILIRWMIYIYMPSYLKTLKKHGTSFRWSQKPSQSAGE